MSEKIWVISDTLYPYDLVEKYMGRGYGYGYGGRGE